MRAYKTLSSSGHYNCFSLLIGFSVILDIELSLFSLRGWWLTVEHINLYCIKVAHARVCVQGLISTHTIARKIHKPVLALFTWLMSPPGLKV